MVEVPKQLHLSQCSQAKHGVIERCNLLDRDFLTRGLVQSGTVEGSQVSAQVFLFETAFDSLTPHFGREKVATYQTTP